MKGLILKMGRFLSPIIKFVFITAALFGIKFWIEHTYLGQRVELFTFEILQGQLSSFDSQQELPIVVVDTSNIPLEDNKYKNREKLIEVISAIADQQPLAIGVDIIFSPEKPEVWNTPYDEEFLTRCLAIVDKNNGTPIFLGVGKDMPLDNPSAWLGNKKFKKMAVTLAIYKKRKDAERFLLWARSKNQPERIRSISLALAEKFREKHPHEKPEPPQWLSWAIVIDEEFPGRKEFENDIEFSDALANYSKLEAIRQTKLLNRSAVSIEEFGEKFRNRIVILGNDTTATDTVGVPISEEPVAGVYVHASSVYTLIKEPMYEFKPWFRIFIDILFPLIVFVIVGFFQWLKGDTYNWHRMQRRLVLIGGIIIFAAAIFLVNAAGVLWLDFLFIMMALLIHPWVEDRLNDIWQRIKSSLNQTTA